MYTKFYTMKMKKEEYNICGIHNICELFDNLGDNCISNIWISFKKSYVLFYG